MASGFDVQVESFGAVAWAGQGRAGQGRAGQGRALHCTESLRAYEVSN